jgi:Asp-tRNA(Asn)/Glu-tRNA(Gln) amidotransferase A subunit family amidase
MLQRWMCLLVGFVMTLSMQGGAAAAAPFSPEEASIQSAHRAMKAGQLTARQLVLFYLDRIAAYDKKGPAINAIIHVNAKALEEADRLDAKFRQSGLTGPLHGVPILVKDAIATNDMPTTGGSLSLQGFVPLHEATIVRKLKDAGAIILGKTNLDEFTFGTRGVSSLGGQTLNPYDLSRNPAGSSGGSGAAVAANLAMAALGTDTGSSIRFPSSAMSLVGLRSTVGLVSRSGIMPNSWTQDTGGPLTRSVSDTAKIMDVIAGYDSTDVATAWAVGQTPKTYQDALDAKGLKGARIGVLKSFFGDGENAAAVNAAMQASLKAMQKAGASIITLEDSYDIVVIGEMQVATYETSFYFDQYLKAEGAPHASLEAILASGKYAKAIEDSLRNRVKLSIKDPEFKDRMVKRIELQNRVLKLMADQRLDALVYPFSRTLVGKLGGPQARHNGFLSAVTGFPSLIVPAGFSRPDDHAPLGVPVGMEMLGRPWTEAKLLRLGYSFEQATRFRRPPAGMPLRKTARN